MGYMEHWSQAERDAYDKAGKLVSTRAMAASGTPISSLIGKRVAVDTQDHGWQIGTIESVAYNLYPVVKLDMGGIYRADSTIQVVGEN